MQHTCQLLANHLSCAVSRGEICAMACRSRHLWVQWGHHTGAVCTLDQCRSLLPLLQGPQHPGRCTTGQPPTSHVAGTVQPDAALGNHLSCCCCCCWDQPQLYTASGGNAYVASAHYMHCQVAIGMPLRAQELYLWESVVYAGRHAIKKL